MINAKRCWLGATLVVSCILSWSLDDSAKADDLATALQQRVDRQSAEIELIEGQLELANRKHTQLEELQSEGFASWLEVRRHRVVVDSIAQRLGAARAMQKFLTEVQEKRESTVDEPALFFRQRQSAPVKVFLPGSIRLVGWVEGRSLIEPEEKDRIQSVTQLISLDQVSRFVTSGHSDSLRAATSRVVHAESAAVGHIKLAKIGLEREQLRRDALRRLQSEGYASAHELNMATDRIVQIQSQLEAYVECHQALIEASVGFEDSEMSAADVSYRSVSSWPAIVLNDREFLLHLVDLRGEYYHEQSIAHIARLKSDMLQEVTHRLKAARRISPDRWLASTLNEGKQNEIKAYELETEMERASVIAASERQQILVLEANRFIQQAIAQHEAAQKEVEKSSSAFFGLSALFGWMYPIGGIASTETSKTLHRCGYLERGNLSTLCRISHREPIPACVSAEPSLCSSYDRRQLYCDGLLFSQSNRTFIGVPDAMDSVNRFEVRPVQSLLLTSEQRGASIKATDGRVKPEWMAYLRCNLARNPRSISRTSLLSLSRDWSRASCSYPLGRRSYDDHNAYPFGILRSDLVKCLSLGQPPWYLPGSPTNVRLYSYRVESWHRGRYHRRR